MEVAVCIAQPFTAAGHDSKSPGRIPTEKQLGSADSRKRRSQSWGTSYPAHQYRAGQFGLAQLSLGSCATWKRICATLST